MATSCPRAGANYPVCDANPIPIPLETASPRTGSSAGGARLDWIDYSKGMGITLVVFGHVWRGVHSASLPIPLRTYRVVDAWIYSFHMPLFFFLSGVVIGRSADRPAGRFLRDKLGSIAYPYVLWSSIQGGLNILLSARTNTPLSVSELATDILFRPYAQFWFLYVLLLASVVFLGLHRAIRRPLAIVAIAIVGLEALAVPGIDPPGVLRLTLLYLPYLALGHALEPFLVDRFSGLKTWVLAALATTSLGATAFWASSSGPASLTATLLVALFGIGGVLAAAVMIDRVRGFAALRRLGAATLPVYLAHVVGLAGCRIVLLEVLHIRSVPVHLVAGTIAGLAFPLVLWASVRGTPASLLFSCKRLGQTGSSMRVRRRPSRTLSAIELEINP